MSELFNLITIEEALQRAEERVKQNLPMEIIDITEASGRIVAQDIVSQVDLPPFTRSTMDGYAVKAADTFGASETLPVYLEVVDQVAMGEKAEQEIKSGQAVEVATGGMLPPGADAVVMVEHTEIVGEGEIEVTKAVGEGENIVVAGEDIAGGETLLAQGHRLRPQDIGALAGIGEVEVEVYVPPRVAVISTGDEIIPPEQQPKPGQIRNINTYSIASSAAQIGCQIDYGGIVPDQKLQLKQALNHKLAANDIVILSGGSSVGAKDLTIEVIEELGDPGVVVHGVSIKPGKPTIIAAIEETLVIGLPGHPTSALIVFEIVVKPLLKQLTGEKPAASPAQQTKAQLTRNVASSAGRTEYLRVKLTEQAGQLQAEPMLGKSSLITTMVKADGLVEIGRGREGIKAGTEVPILLFS